MHLKAFAELEVIHKIKRHNVRKLKSQNCCKDKNLSLAVCEMIKKIIFNMSVYGLLRSQKAIFKSYIKEENLRFACVVLNLILLGLKSLNKEAANKPL